MSGNLEASDLSALVIEAEKIAAQARATFDQLSPAQINWKRSPGEWSIGQCFDHLVRSNETYFPLLESIAAGRHKKTLWQRVPILPGFFGRMLIRSVSPESARKLKAPKVFRPSASDIDADVIDRFIRHQGELMRLMSETEKLNPEKIIIPSSVSALVIYNLLDGYRILLTHERRHLLQAERVMAAEEFPRA